MGIMRSVLLACSQSRWLREQAPRHIFMRRAVTRFMPGESAEDALAAAAELRKKSIGSILTHLGENVSDPAEAERVTQHYLEVLDRIAAMNLDAELSVKLTQLGLDLDHELCYSNLERIIQRVDEKGVVWIDMEASNYVDVTLEIYRRARQSYPKVGVCLQAYLYRTARDLESLIAMGPAIRLVKGAYREPPDRAFRRKRDVDESYFSLCKTLLSPEARAAGVRAAFATHDRRLIRRIIEFVDSNHIGKNDLEFQMLYGIQRAEQARLVREGWRERVLISYGSYWFPWFMRRLAERPANVFFLLRNLF
ncbi:MAG TPA: proline dehydrogenase family protein [Terriglobia bacterium]|nr:proline dehydrogenase family protein [Terriglobia bacterium]